MSEVLRRKLHAHQDSKQLAELLTQIASLTMVHFVTDVEDLGVDIAYQSVLNSDVQPLSRIAVSASQRDIAVWLHGLVKQAQLQGTCYLKVWDFGFAPWVEVRVNDSGEWLTSLWSHLKNHAFLIVNRERRILLIIDEEEYWYEAYLRELPHQI